MKKNVLVWVFCCASFLIIGQNEFKVSFYNVPNISLEESPPNRTQYSNTIIPEIGPEIMACELNNANGTIQILSVLRYTISPTCQLAASVNNTSYENSNNNKDIQNIVFYDTCQFLLKNKTFSIEKIKENKTLEIIGSTLITKKLGLQNEASQFYDGDLINYDSFGQLIMTLKVDNSVYVEENVSGWASGLYITESSGRITSLKLIV